MKTLVKGQIGDPQGELMCGDFSCPVALGKNGVIAAAQKREGDGRTPLGSYRILYGMYRPDRVPAPALSGLEWLPLHPAMGWCDDPTDAAYNTLVPQGYNASHEQLWREDCAYDRLLVTSHNLPAAPGLGSAIFIHQLPSNKSYTAGCIALEIADFTNFLAQQPKTLTVLVAGLSGFR